MSRRFNFWLSFAEPEGFLGCLVMSLEIEEGDATFNDAFLTALKIAHLEGVNPGGEVQASALHDAEFDMVVELGFANRLLTKVETQELVSLVNRRRLN